MAMIPEVIRPFLWSYDPNSLDINTDKKRIITNTLNLGTEEATKWIFENYSLDDIKETLTNPLPGEWSDKSLNYWTFILDVKPGNHKHRELG
jgi:hypothetical protein